MKVRLTHRIEYAALRCVSWLVGVLPHRVALALAWGAARVAYAANRQLRVRTFRRLRQALGAELGAPELARIGWLAYRNLVFTVVEGMKLSRIRREWVTRNMAQGPVAQVRAELSQGRGLIIAVPHMGNWELAGIALQSQGVHLITLVRKQKNPLVNAWLNRVRTRTGVEAIDTHSRDIGEVARKLVAGNKVLTILPDVRAKSGGVSVRFLEAETLVPLGTVRYARSAGLPILTGQVVRSGWTRHEWSLTGRIEPDQNASEEADGRRIMQYIMDRFSESVQAHPEDYFWFNKRWVLGPEGAP